MPENDWDEADLITARECADLLGIAYSTWVAYVSRTESTGAPVPVVTKFKRRLWSRTQVLAWDKARTGSPVTNSPGKQRDAR